MSFRSWFARSLRTRSGLLQWALLVGAIAFIAWIIRIHGGDLRSAFRLTPRIFVLLTLSSFATFALNGIELQVLAARFGRRIPFGEGQILGLMVSTLNYLPMKTGTVLNGVLMKARYELPLSDFTALVAGSSVVHLWVCGVMAGVALLVGDNTRVGWGLLFLLAPSAIVAGLVVWGRTHEAGRFDAHESRLVRAAWRAVDGIGGMFSDGTLLAKDISINIGLVTLWASRSYWSFQALGIHASFGSVLTVTALGILFSRLSIIPGGVGLRETGAALGSTITGLSAEVGFAASVLDRAVTLIWLLVIGVPASVYLLRISGVGLEDALRTSAGLQEEDADGVG